MAAEFLDVIGKKVFPPCYSQHLYYFIPPPPLSKSLKIPSLFSAARYILSRLLLLPKTYCMFSQHLPIFRGLQHIYNSIFLFETFIALPSRLYRQNSVTVSIYTQCFELIVFKYFPTEKSYLEILASSSSQSKLLKLFGMFSPRGYLAGQPSCQTGHGG